MNRIFSYILLPVCGMGMAISAYAGDTPSRLGERNPLIPPFMEVFDDFPQGSEYDTFDRYFQWINSDGDKNPSGSPRSWGLYNFNGESGGRQFSKCAYLQYPLEVRACDDWLIPRAIRLEAGKYYLVRMDASLFLDNSIHSLEVKMGEYNDAEGMTYSIIPKTEISSIRPELLQGWFVPEFDGLYYMGIHGTSEKALAEPGYLFVDNIGIEAPRTGREPETVSGISFISDPDGTPSAAISFTMPSKAIDGSDLTGELTLTVTRDGSVVKTIKGSRGEEISFTDTTPKADFYTYTFTVSNDAGKGAEIREWQFVGVSNLLPPTVTSIKEFAHGKVRLTWEAPGSDVNGTRINPEKVGYNVYNLLPEGYEIVKSGYAGTEIELDMNLDEEEQTTAEFIVRAVMNGLESEPAQSDFIFIGTPYQLPLEHHFTGSNDEPIIGAHADAGVRWRYLDDYSDPKAQDGDGGYICMVATESGQHGGLSTGKIDFSSVSNPFLSFYTYVYEGDENVLTIKTVDCDTEESSEVAEFLLQDLGKTGWTRIICPLSNVSGKTARVVIEAAVISHGYVPIDNLRIDQLSAIDLGVDKLDYPSYADGNSPYNVWAEITNYGSETVKSYTVDLICDGKTIDTFEGGKLESFETVTVKLSGKFTARSSEMPLFTVAVTAEGDETADNNTSAPFNITFLAPNLPTATDLKATDNSGTLLLTWLAPDLSKAAPEQAMEDFEDYAPFTTELNGFTMSDEDGGNIVGLRGVEMPVAGTPQAFWTMTSEGDFGFLYTLGRSSLITMATVNEERRPIQNDDWLISPELYGGRQTISFMACAQTIDYGPETFEVYSSSTTPDIANFNLVKVETEVYEEWTQFYVTLPEGTKYFAIRCTSNDRMMFTLDEISYIPTGTPRQLDLKGYNVYRNDEKINSELVTGTMFEIPSEDTDADYYVTAVYDKGESTASNVVNTEGSGVITVAEEDAQDEYFDLRGLRLNTVNPGPGVYVHKKGDRVEKIIIR